MALATKCPQCGALFRVVADQLKLRGGLVRCGQCRAVFDAIGSLTYVDDTALAQSRTVTASSPGQAAPSTATSAEETAARQALGPSTTLRIAPIAPATLAGNVPLRIELPKPPPEEPAVVRRRAKAAVRGRVESTDSAAETSPADLKVPTLLARTRPAPVAQGVQPLADDIEFAEPPPAEAAAAEHSADAEPPPSFMRQKRRKPRGFSVVYGGGTGLLVLLAAIQLAVIFRGELMVHWPQSRPLLMEFCTVFRCTVNWPTQADQLAVIGTELQAIPGTDALELTAVIRNRAAFRQALPAVEVTLMDARSRALARKVFVPADYLASAGEPSSRLQDGFGAGSDFTIRIFFEARGLTPAGFLVYPFYL